MTALQLALQGRRLKSPRSLPEAELLATELAAFRLRRVTFGDAEAAEWRVGRHDDLVFAVALGCWHAGRFRPLRAGSIRMGPLLIHSSALGSLTLDRVLSIYARSRRCGTISFFPRSIACPSMRSAT